MKVGGGASVVSTLDCELCSCVEKVGMESAWVGTVTFGAWRSGTTLDKSVVYV